MVPMTFRFIILWLDVVADCLHLEISRQMCRDHHQPYDLFQDINRIHDEKYHPCPWWFVLSSTTSFSSLNTERVHVLDWILSSLLSNLCYILPRSITIFDVKNVVRIAPPLKNSWYSDTSHHHNSFLAPMLILTGMPTSERCCLDSVLLSNPIALELMVDSSSLDYWITNHHSNIDHAT